MSSIVVAEPLPGDRLPRGPEGLTAHDAAFERLDRVLKDSCSSELNWPDAVAAAVAASLEFAAESPEEAFLLALAPTAAEPRLAQRAYAANEHLLSLFRVGRERCPEVAEVPQLTERAMLLGVIHLVGAELFAGNTEELPGMAPELAQILLAPYLGANKAKRFALAA